MKRLELATVILAAVLGLVAATGIQAQGATGQGDGEEATDPQGDLKEFFKSAASEVEKDKCTVDKYDSYRHKEFPDEDDIDWIVRCIKHLRRLVDQASSKNSGADSDELKKAERALATSEHLLRRAANNALGSLTNAREELAKLQLSSPPTSDAEADDPKTDDQTPKADTGEAGDQTGGDPAGGDEDGDGSVEGAGAEALVAGSIGGASASGKLKPTGGSALVAAQVRKENLLKEIERLTGIVARVDGLIGFSRKKQFVNFEDYENFIYRIPAGFEFLGTENDFSNGFPRLGFLASFRFGGRRVHDGVQGWKGGRYGFLLSFSAVSSSSAEQELDGSGAEQEEGGEGDPTGDGSNGDPMPPPDPEPETEEEPAEELAEQSLEFELGLFSPWYRSASRTANDLRTYVGPIVTAGGRKTEGEVQVDFRYYAGIRFASNPEQYWDLLVGRTDSLRSDRVEVRGQIPLRVTKGGNRVFLGATGNFGIGDEKDEVLDAAGETVRPPEEDVIRIYVQWNGDASTLFSGGGFDQ